MAIPKIFGGFRKTTKYCEVDGQQHEYHCCSKSRSGYDNSFALLSSIEYIGQGHIHSIDGRVQKKEDSNGYHFWRKK